MSKKYQKKNMANKPVGVIAKVETVDVCEKVDYVILPNQFSIMCQDDLLDFSDRTGIGTCVDYIKKKHKSTGAQMTAKVVPDIESLLTSIYLGEVKTPTVVCAQCHGLPQGTQGILMRVVAELHERGINVIIVKDGIEFRADEETTSVIRRISQHVRAVESLLN